MSERLARMSNAPLPENEIRLALARFEAALSAVDPPEPIDWRSLFDLCPQLELRLNDRAQGRGEFPGLDRSWTTDRLAASLEGDLEPLPAALADDRAFTRRWKIAWQAVGLRLDFDRRLQREKLASMRQLAYGASHEINNPLANISTRAQTLLADEQNPERRHKLAAIVAQAFRAHEMIANLMLFAHPPQLDPRSFAARDWATALTPELLSHVESQGTRLDLHWPAAHVVWHGDPVQLAVLLSALVRNSAEAIGVGGHILVTVQPIVSSESPELWWELTVDDDGPGLSDLARRHAFDPFYSGREAGRGLGFGLSKAWIITRRHQGSIDIQSPLPEQPASLLGQERSELPGTRVVVRLPLGAPQGHDREPDDRPSRASSDLPESPA